MDTDAVITVAGPTEGVALALLWENMLCTCVPSRAEWKEVQVARQEYHQNKNSSKATQWQEFLFSHHAKPPKDIHDNTWKLLFNHTEKQFPFELHAVLWAKFVDESGFLPEKNLNEHIFSRFLPFIKLDSISEPTRKFYRGHKKHYKAPHLICNNSKPILEIKDEDGLIHCSDGPSLIFGDGSSKTYWRGMEIPEEWIEGPSEEWMEKYGDFLPPLQKRSEFSLPLPYDALTMANLEMRRAAIEILGWTKILEKYPHQVIDEDEDPEIGTLIKVHLPAANRFGTEVSIDCFFIRVRCGTGRDFTLSVPPWCRTALEANAWTYGLEPEEYKPEYRT